ncbi:MAG: PP0621 family protein [Sulfurimonas sp.]|uniref:PP0621 family protein n=1 Tax=Sulfurimonas sp. TaxID=2022749 RepID=UPI0025ED9ABE|nr:PP0621 family protein [Sulfurimonas sp.]MCK9453851.1 hypothetical protein [Sulfurimonas sp.]
MILKILLVIGVIALVYFTLIKKKPSIDKSQKEKKSDKIGSEMIECSVCGIYFDLDDAFLSDAKYYCSKECAKKKN